MEKLLTKSKLGLSSFKDHPMLQLNQTSSLTEYSRFLSLIELDTVFHAIPKKETVLKWQNQVPKDFSFIVKAYGGMTDQKDYQHFFATKDVMYQTFQESFEPLLKSQQLKSVLFQFSPYFTFSKESALFLREVRIFLPDWPIAVEFRHNSWYQRASIKKTLGLLKELEMALVAVDEPQTSDSVPFFLYPTTNYAYIRLHGRNKAGWLSKEMAFRTNYDYSFKELAEIFQQVAKKQQDFQEFYFIFNNNAGLHAAKNLVTFQQEFLKQGFVLPPQQTQLF